MSPPTADTRIPPRRWGVVAGIVTFGIQLLQVRLWSSRLPIADEWQTMKIFGRAATSGVRPGMLWEQHNEHRIVIANAVFLLVRRLGGWVVLAPTIVSALMMSVAVATLVTTLLRLAVRPALVAVAMSFAITPLQWENTIWGFQVQFVALVAGVIVTLCAVARRPVLDRRTVIVMMLGGVWCTGTIASGVLVWGVLFLIAVGLVRSGNTPWPARTAYAAAASVAIAGAVLVVLYRLGYVTPGRPGPGDLGNRVRWSLRALVFPFAGFGGRSPTDASLPVGVIFGAIIGALMIGVLIIGLVALVRSRGDDGSIGRLVLCGGLLVWVIPQVVLIGMARAEGGELVSRYASLFVWTAVAAVIASDRLIDGWTASGLVPPLVSAIVALAVVQHAGLVRGAPAAARSWASKGTLDTTLEFLERGSIGNVASPNPYANERVFGELLREAQAKDWLGQLPDEVVTQLRWAPMATGTAWSAGGSYPGAGVPSGDWASWSGDDARTGTLLSQPFRVSSDVVRVVVRGGPERRGNRLELVAADDAGRVLARLTGPPPDGRSAVWEADTGSLRGDRVRLRAVDGATGFLGWFAVEPPTQPSRLSRAVDRVIGSSPGIVLLGLGLAAMAALAASVPAGTRRLRRPLRRA